ncbi:hypothetical protein TNCT_269151 [Trichonephila clavata]|uniref:Uncharacterized protein n=1 Tax=Trichonephila clavata TaxID=2740835 RepID=A0A8X6HXG6_TRICU|nr:hypothetical protein TNCT_269151 [Trichonephila clavata]
MANAEYGLLIHHVVSKHVLDNQHGWSFRYDTRFPSSAKQKSENQEQIRTPSFDWPPIPPIGIIKPPLDTAPL